MNLFSDNEDAYNYFQKGIQCYALNYTMEKKKEHKVIIVGLDNAGKTTILYQFSMNEVVHTSPTIGSNVEEIVINNTRFLMWDIGGQESLRSSWNTYYTNTEFVIVVVDSTDRERISVTREELYKMLAHEDLRKAGLLIFANKQDVKECMSVAEISQFLKLTSIKDHQWHIQACCALTGEGAAIHAHLSFGPKTHILSTKSKAVQLPKANQQQRSDCEEIEMASRCLPRGVTQTEAWSRVQASLTGAQQGIQDRGLVSTLQPMD
ncbi:ADP-ribosylation factor-like protein 5A [Sciurus carolinensis]|uniref:ADP-ribosylation factor-like protein 5A n=1 Tax=Sciurus carolinensis TaxID=30640 RepID=A0AA41MCR9_SCICA|nr:ADP-ribosylation factor-like protein 5A [Sciurus carolinensis]